MRPTVEEQLQGIGRLLDAAVAESLPPAAADLLADASRRLRRLQRSCPKLNPFLTADNEDLTRVLAEIAALLPPGTIPVTAAVPSVDVGVDAANATNEALRGVLAHTVTTLPPGDAGDRARAAIAAHLRRRLRSDPFTGRPMQQT